MTNDTTPSQIARKTLSTLAERKIAPTPDNYARLYQEISGKPEADSTDKTAALEVQPLPGVDRRQIETTVAKADP